MKAWQVARLGEPLVALDLLDLPDPTPGAHQVLVRVTAAAVNFPDALMCRGEYQNKPALPFTPGIELCGVVQSVGPGVKDVSIGERVLGSTALPCGAFAELALMDRSTVFAAPKSLDDAEAASLHVGYQTAWFALHRRAALTSGETLVVHAAAGGVGSAAVHLGKALGARVIAVVGNAAKGAVARQLGADVVIDRGHEDFVEIVNAETSGRGADVIYDPVGGDTYRRSTKCIAFEGRILLVGFAGGEIQNVALNHALIKNYSILGLHWGLYNTKQPGAVQKCHGALSEMADDGHIRPFVSERLEMAGLADGVQRLANGETAGRLVLVP